MEELRHLLRLTCVFLAGALLARGAGAQCAAFTPGFGPRGVNGSVEAAVVWDDGTGPALFVAGRFATAGEAKAANIAKWDGVRWSELGSGLDDGARCLAVYDDGTGAKLYVGGEFRYAGGQLVDRIAAWNGSSWSVVGGYGLGGAVRAMLVHDSGGGPKLHVGGDFQFQVATSMSLRFLATYSGAGWAEVGTGLNGAAYALSVHDAGSGPELWIGGWFTTAGSSCVLRWNGATFVNPGFATDAPVNALCSFDDGGGPALFLAGSFATAGGAPAARVARWRAGTVSALGAGLDGTGRALAAFDDGTGAALYAAGDFVNAGGGPAPHLARWNGTGWSSVASGVDDNALALAVHDEGGGPALFVGGNFHLAGNEPARGIVRWRAGALTGVGTGAGLDGTVTALETFDDGTGRALYVGGSLRSADGARGTVFRWDGVAWTALRDAPGFEVRDFAALDTGSGPVLHAVETRFFAPGHPQGRLLRWNGSAWTVEYQQNGAYLLALGVYDDGSGPALYAGGFFTDLGVPDTSCIARWNGTGWSALATGLPYWAGVHAMLAFDDGSGPALYIGSHGTSVAGSFVAGRIARWNGTAWSPVGAGFDNDVQALTLFDDGSGPALIAGGRFDFSAGTPVNAVARWDGASWLPLGANDYGAWVATLLTYDDHSGSGPELYAGGFDAPMGFSTGWGAARLHAGSWQRLASGVDDDVRALAVFDDQMGSAPALYLGGAFATADGLPSSGLARYLPTALPGCTGDPGVPFCFGDALDTQVTQVCPCFNYGGPRRGCANSANAAGALLVATGSTAVDPGTGTDTVVLASSGMPATVNLGSVFLQGDAEHFGGTIFGDGVRCVDGTLIRLAYKPNLGGAAQFPEAGNLSLSQRGGVVPGSGATRSYQVYYRSAAAAFCPPATFNVTSGMRILW